MKVNDRPSGVRLSQERRLKVLDLISTGMTIEEASRECQCSTNSVNRVLERAGGRPARRSRRRSRSPFRLSLSEREEIRVGLACGESCRSIARSIGRAPSTVSREVSRCGGRRRYRATRAEDRASLQSLRPKPSKLAQCPGLKRQVKEMLEDYLSPEQISARLKLDFPDDPEMRISHETIYQSLYVQSRGTFRKNLTAYLRTGRSKRKPQGRASKQGRIKEMVSISERPAEVGDRAVPGHWEGDLIVGKGNRTFIGTLVERQTRFVMLTYLGSDSTTEHVCGQIAEKIKELPENLWLSLTWDQGKEMAGHQGFTVSTGVKVYFCDPHSPWQRGSNENTNGLLRQYFPKGTDLAVHGQVELDRVAAQMNRRPRETLGWRTPSEKLAELVLR